ncbi:Uncharacterised protein [uncultured Bacteroides sp.]|nr:Uncharacterised protein [uncultured Bacteroides sp.]
MYLNDDNFSITTILNKHVLLPNYGEMCYTYKYLKSILKGASICTLFYLTYKS